MSRKARRRFRHTPVKKRLHKKIKNKFNKYENTDEYDKIFAFKDFEQNAINLTIQLRIDCITRSEFFRAMIYGYLERDPDMVNFIENYVKKECKNRTPQYYEKTLKKEEEEFEKISRSLTFSKDEVDSIFDLIEKELEENL